MGKSCVYTVDNDEPAEWIVLVNQVVEARD